MSFLLRILLCGLLSLASARAIVVTSDTSVNVPTLPGYSYKLQVLGTWGGATVTLQAYVGDSWRALPNGAHTANFEGVQLAASREMRALVTGASGSTSLSITWAEVREGDVSAAAAAIGDGELSIAQVADLPAIFAPVETLPTTLLIRDLFDGGTEVATAAAGTRAASPGPGTMTAVGSPGVSQVVAGKNALLLTRNPSNAGGGTTAVRYDGVSAGAGLTMIIRVIPAMTGRYGPEFYGFSLSSAALESNSAGSFFISNGGGASTEGLNLFMIPRDASMTVTPDFTSFADFGQLISLAVKYESSTKRTYWIQGGTMAESFGCHNYTNDWLQVGEEVGATAIADGTTVYPFVAKPNYSGGAAVVREVSVYSSWSPSVRHAELDFKAGGIGVHCPTINRDPVTGLMVVANNNGTTHENIDTKINGRVRLANGTWGASQVLVAAPGTPAVMNVGSLSVVGNALWLTYWRNASGGGGGTLYRRTVSVNPADGVVTMGSEVTLGITGAVNFSFAPFLTIPSGAYAGRILAAVHDSSGFDSKIARSTDGGITWTSSSAIAKHAAAAGWHVEPSLVLESDGAIGCYMRTAGGVVCYSRSIDGGVTWPTSVPIYNLPSFGRTMVRNLADGSILAMGSNSRVQRRYMTGWKLGDNGTVLGSFRAGDYAISGSGGTTEFQYPDFIQEGDDLLYVLSQQGSQGNSTCIQFHERRWLGDLELAYELTGAPRPVKSSVNVWPDSNLFLGPKGGNVVVLTSGASVATPCKLADNFQLTLGTNVTLSAPTNPLPWQRCTWVFIQDGTGSRTLSLDSIFETGMLTPTLSTAASAHDYMEAMWNPEKGKWQVMNFTPAYKPVYRLTLAANVSAPSTSYVVSGETLSLPAGSYKFEGMVGGTTASATGGINAAFFQGSGDTACNGYTLTQSSSTQGVGATPGMTFRNGGGLFQYLTSSFVDAPNKGCSASFSGTVTFTGTVSITARCAQRTATDASNPALLMAGSFIDFTKL